MAGTFYLFTSLRFDPALSNAKQDSSSPLYMLDFHRDRVLKAAKHWQWDKAVADLDGEEGLGRLSDFILKYVGSSQGSPLRVKVCVAEDGLSGCEMSDVPESPLVNFFPKWLPNLGATAEDQDGLPSKEVVYEVLVDGALTARSKFTHHKTSQREMYDESRRRAGIKPVDKKEVLLVGEDGCIMEGSTTTPYFWRHGRWVTPPVSKQFSYLAGSGGNEGTTRRWALER